MTRQPDSAPRARWRLVAVLVSAVAALVAAAVFAWWFVTADFQQSGSVGVAVSSDGRPELLLAVCDVDVRRVVVTMPLDDGVYEWQLGEGLSPHLEAGFHRVGIGFGQGELGGLASALEDFEPGRSYGIRAEDGENGFLAGLRLTPEDLAGLQPGEVLAGVPHTDTATAISLQQFRALPCGPGERPGD